MRIIAKRTLRDFWIKHADAEQQLKSWYRETEKTEWENINELRKDYPSASILQDNRIVFNIKGNNYRLIVKFNFEYKICWIRFIGTHPEYDKIDSNTI
ncbi:addiction module toxin RelE [Christiangramia fulva]|uniref:Addiction module toxin RelE n=1 Tax=Christiangramia fulva TaxID=2126553 RepID=A0A2R3Z746_9FLAO|nr:type II toxin-antitoxin system HigB family toxin [Christiangramia fulva]AVR46075.1 addiction module toxin RelE [Christiangramia fulva]